MNHVYEMRMYHAAPGKLDALISRFALHTNALFARYHLKPIAYWVPRENSQNLLLYILEHDSIEEAEKNWADFRNDAEWQKVKAETDADTPLAASIVRYFMDKVDFSNFESGVSCKP